MTIPMLKKLRLRTLSKFSGADQRRRRLWPFLSLPLGFAAFLGTQHVLIRNVNRGLNLDRELDSLIYISVADSLVAGDGITTFSGDYSSYWPPLYPITMALVGSLKIDTILAGFLTNIMAFGLVIILTGIWLHRNTRSQLLALGGAVTVGTSYTFIWLSSNVLSEPLFICLTLLALVQLGRFIESEQYRQSAIVWSASIAALAAVTRYMGITVVLTALIIILIRTRLPLFRRLKYMAFYCFISIGPLTLWIVRNWLYAGHPVGNRSGVRFQTSITLSDMLSQLSDVVHLWFFSKERSGWLGLLLVVVVGVMAIGMIRVVNYRWIRDLEPVLPFVIFIFIYLITHIVVVPSTVGSGIHDRHVSPVYVPIILVLIVLFYRFYKSIILDKSWVIKWTFILIYMGLGISWFAVVSRAARLSFDETAEKVEHLPLSVKGYTRNSEMIDYLISNPIDGTIYSNKAAALYGVAVLYDVAELKRVYYIYGVDFVPGVDYTRGVDYIPEATDPRPCLSWIRQVGESVRRPYLVYLFEEIASDSCNPVELASQSNYLELVARTNDGVVYRVTTQLLK